MRTLTAADVIDVWEQGARAHPLVRPLVVLAAAYPDDDPAVLAAQPLGTLHARLWAVRASLVGTAVVANADCPPCGEQVEIELDGAGLVDPPVVVPGPGVRPLTLADLFAAAQAPDPAAVLASAAPDTADPAAALADADPGAELLLELECPRCGHGWNAPLDVASFLWAELGRLAAEAFRDVDLLARTYGWGERAVLDLSPARRRCYVELARGGP